MSKGSDEALFGKVLPDTVAFGIGLGLACFLKWETKDLVWSLWLSSLVLGYLTLLSAIVAGSYLGVRSSTPNGVRDEQRGRAVFVGIAVGIIVFTFFSLHFCGFHAGHASFLNEWFPIDGMPEHGFAQAFANPPLLWILAFRHLIRPYGLFLVPAIIAERHSIFRPLVEIVHAAQTIERSNSHYEQMAKGTVLRGTPFIVEAIERPYINVARIHVLILSLVLCNAVNVDSFLMCVAISFVYFSPWRVLWRASKAGTVDRRRY